MRNEHVRRVRALALALALVAAASLAPVAAQAQTNSSTVNVTGIVPQTGGAFGGTFTVTQFTNQGARLLATGTLVGNVFDAAGNVVGTVTQTITIPAQATGACPILHLDLGPLNLDLLGLQVHLNQIVLDLVAQPGPGNLLGNLLCAVAGLLDQPPGRAVNDLVATLNQLLAAL